MVQLPVRRVDFVLDVPLDITSAEASCERIFAMVQQKDPAYVCYATAHMLIEANRRPDVSEAYRDAAMINPDGQPLAWGLRLLGFRHAHCVSGPSHTPFLLREAEQRGISVGFYGGRQTTLDRIQACLAEQYPALKVPYLYSPPFRELTVSENEAVLEDIRASGTQILMVGLGSVKQELWMHDNYESLPCVCLGVGAVFEFLSGEKVKPPVWAQRIGCAGLVRLCQEPRRLFKRNLYSPVFAAMFALQFMTELCWRLVGISREKSRLAWRNMQ